VAVLYAGTVAETARTRDLFRRPSHPYTQALLAALPRRGSRGQPLAAIDGQVPSGLHLAAGCPFTPRCRFAFDRCRVDGPVLRQVAAEHTAACHLY
jgi:peptide/nickel transport system ATP-binding protein